MKKILFLCTGNSARSIIAECILNHLGQNKYLAYSAGSNPVGSVNPYTVKVLKKNNINYKKIFSKSWDFFKKVEFDIVITVCNNAANETCPLFIGSSKKLHWDLKDPAIFKGNEEEKLAEFQNVYNQIENLIKREFINK